MTKFEQFTTPYNYTTHQSAPNGHYADAAAPAAEIIAELDAPEPSATILITKTFTGGMLVGLTHTSAMSFVNQAAALKWLKVACEGIENPIGGSPYRVTQWQWL